MPGIRIQHPTARNGTFLVKHYRRYPVPFYCSECKVFETYKTYHLKLGDDGSVIVSERVLERLKEVGLAGFSIVNEVRNPPPITLSIPGLLNKFKVFELRNRNGNERPIQAE